MRNRLQQLRSEDGVALPIALIVLFVLLTLSAAAVALSSSTAHSTNRDAADKRALEAAQSGLRVALYRINSYAPTDSNCVGLTVGSPASNGLCTDDPETLDSNSTFQYWTSPANPAPSACAGYSLQSQLGLAQRCVTAIGTVNGVSDRVQVRVAAYDSVPLFPVPGILGLNSLYVANNDNVTGSVGTNGQLTVGNGATVTGSSILGPGAPAPIVGTNGNPGVVVRRSPGTGQFVLPPVSVGNAATVNSDSRITTGQDQSSGITFDPTTDELTTTTNGATLTLTGDASNDPYYFCNFVLRNNATLSIAPGARITIIVDAPPPDDPNSTCPAGSGNFTMSNNTINNPSGDPTALKIFVYGSNNLGSNVVTFSNNSNVAASIYAPHSTVNFENNSGLFGAVSGYNVNLINNFNFTWSSLDSALTASSLGLYYRTAWRECPATPTSSSDPTSGC